MLRKLQNRLRAVLIAVFMAIVTLILAFSFQNTLQARKTADITYIQRMASLLIYELEADPESPTALLSYYERETQVYSILKDASGDFRKPGSAGREGRSHVGGNRGGFR